MTNGSTESLESVTRVALRLPLMKFAERMEEILKANDHKDGWGGCSPGWLLDQVGKELREARTAYREKYLRTVVQPEAEEAVKALQDEAVDVANFCMMLWDVLEEERERVSVRTRTSSDSRKEKS